MTSTTPYSEGFPSSDICVVAEAPGNTEWMKQRPLVGPSGKLFDQALHDAGITRIDIQIANVSRERIPNIGVLLGKHGATEKGKAAIADIRDRLSDSRAKVFVPMGNLALFALTGKQSITKHRGSPIRSSLLPGRKVIPALHPAACLPFRGREHYIYTIAADLRKAKRHADNDLPFGPPRDLIIHPSFADVASYLHECKKAEQVGWDIETLNGHISCISFSYHPMHAISIPFYGDPWNEREECEIWRMIDWVLGDPKIGNVGVNITAFDIPFIFNRNRIITRGTIHDIMVASRIMYPDFPAKLEFLASVFSDEPYYKDDRKLWSQPSKDLDTFYRYNAKDSAVALDCLVGEHGMWDELMTDYADTYASTMKPFEACFYMGMRGFDIDTDRLKETQVKIKAELATAKAKLDEVADYPFSPTSPKAVMNYFYIHKGIKAYTKKVKLTSGATEYRPTSDDKALARIARRYQFPEAYLIQQIRGLSKLLSTYLEVDLDADGKLRCVYNMKGTSTARLSSKETPWGTGMNFQNLDPRFKRFLVA